jgi:diguanylate cyclase (GGDEF)-like protein
LHYHSIFRLADVYVADQMEIFVAVIIIVSTILIFFFMFRTVSKDFRKEREALLAMKQEQREAKKAANPVTKEHLFEGKAVQKPKGGDIVDQIEFTLKGEKEGTVSALFYLNLDNFKSTVEKIGAEVAGKALKEIAGKLKKFGDKTHISGNWKDDIFLYYYPGPIDNDLIKQMGEKILATVSEPLKSTPEILTTSIGVVLFPFDGIHANQLIKNAEIALYVAKKQGKNQYSMYSAEPLDVEQFNMTYYQEIKRSIQNEEFVLYYQPMVDIKTGKIIGLESLLRWNHPTMGVLPPAKFLNVMDLTGDITWFGSWGFERVVKQYVIWKNLYRIRDMFISINLSPKQLMMDGLAKTFFDIVRKNEFDTEAFCLEIIDFYTVIKSPIAVHNLQEFRRYGFRLAVDDLGDNFELIADMDRLIANIVKINREDMMKIENNYEEAEQILRVITAAIAKQKVVIVEGIENEAMISLLAAQQVRFMQGYYFGAPKSTEETQKLLKNPPWGMNSFSKLIR